MRPIRAGLLAGLCLIALGVPAGAVEVDRGVQELQLGVEFSDLESSGETISVDVLYGFMLGDGHEAGPILSYVRIDPDSKFLPSIDAGSAGLFYRCNFDVRSDSVVPFIEFDVQRTVGDEGTEIYEGSYAGQIALRVMPSRSASINIVGTFRELDWAQRPFNADDLSERSISAGISIFFGRE